MNITLNGVPHLSTCKAWLCKETVQGTLHHARIACVAYRKYEVDHAEALEMNTIRNMLTAQERRMHQLRSQGAKWEAGQKKLKAKQKRKADDRKWEAIRRGKIDDE